MMIQKKRKKRNQRNGKSSSETTTNQVSKEKGQDLMKSIKMREYLSHKIDLKHKQHLNNSHSVRSLQNPIEAM